jgi:hypothetical protein
LVARAGPAIATLSSVAMRDAVWNLITNVEIENTL